MIDDEINKAIAEACGWTNIHMHREECVQLEWLVGSPPESPLLTIGLPNYKRNLSAMAEAEKTIKDDNSMTGMVAYCNTLMQICGSHRACVMATAPQRAEAFLRMIGKLL